MLEKFVNALKNSELIYINLNLGFELVVSVNGDANPRKTGVNIKTS
jgi:hypothetical protein